MKQQIQLEVDTLNLEIEQLVGLQNQINATLEDRVPNDLMDKRDRLVNQIAERVDVQRFEFVQNNMGLGLAGSTVNIGMTPIRFETVTDASGDIQIQLEGGDRPVEFAGGRIAALLDVHNNMIGGFAPNTRRQNIEGQQILLERLSIKRRQIPSIHPHSLGAQECCTVRCTRSGCGINIVTRPSADVAPAIPATEPFGFIG